MRLIFLAVCLAFVCNCWASEEEEHNLASTTIGGQKTLVCKEADDEDSISWSFIGEGLNDTVTVASGDKYSFDGHNLVIKNVQQAEMGIYRCFDEENKQLQSFQVDISLKLKQMPLSVSIDEGSSTENDIKCSMVSSGQEVVFKWFTRPDGETNKSLMTPICSKSVDTDCSIPDALPLFDKKDKLAPVVPLAERSEIRYGDDEGIPFSILTIKNTDLTDRMVFICKAKLKGMDVSNCTASKHCDMTETILRVKDPLAALWPFCGIVVEVILLCVVIFFCERRKSTMEKEDYDEGSNGNNVASSRNRK